MRTRTGILITIGALLGAMVVFLVLFWFAFPQWWPEVVIRYSPSLRHVLLADSYRFERAHHADIAPYPQYWLVKCSRFEKQFGSTIFEKMESYDDGNGGRLRSVIIRYLGDRLDQQKARIMLWKFRNAGDQEADWVLREYTLSLPQGVPASSQNGKRSDGP